MNEPKHETDLSFDEVENIFNRSMRKNSEIVSRLIAHCKELSLKCSQLEKENAALIEQKDK